MPDARKPVKDPQAITANWGQQQDDVYTNQAAQERQQPFS
jgi:hypothetical protein